MEHFQCIFGFFVQFEGQFAVKIVRSRKKEEMLLRDTFSVFFVRNGAFMHVTWQITDFLNGCVVATDVYSDHDTAVGVETTLVADEVAQRIEHRHFHLYLIIIAHARNAQVLGILDYVRMSSDAMDRHLGDELPRGVCR